MNHDGDKRNRASETVLFGLPELSIHPRHKQGFLTVIRGGGTDLGQSKPVGDAIEIGRAKSCGLCLANMQVSSRHALISHGEDGSYVLEDLGSTNGTRLNGLPLLSAAELVEGDKIYMGNTVLRFAMADDMDLVYHDELTQLVRIDPLTGLESKRCFDDALNINLAHALRTKTMLSLMMMDMDGLKAINDKHGHLFGAHVISETGRLIGRVVHSRGRACRFGGDEFTALLPGLGKPSAVQVGEEIRWQLERANLEKDGIQLRPTLSIGVASFPQDGTTVPELVDAADRALYRAKNAGKNRVSI